MSDANQPVDGITPIPPETPSFVPEAPVPDKLTKRMKRIILVGVSIPYALYVAWCLFLLSILPSPTNAFQELVVPGVVSAAAGAVALLLLGVFIMKRVMSKQVTNRVRAVGIIRLSLYLLPGLIMSGLVPYLIIQEPRLSIQITHPTEPSAMIAPVSVTFNMELAQTILASRGLKVQSYVWDFDADGEENDRTLEPETTAYFERPGAHVVTAILELHDGTTRRVSTRVAIPKAVFSVRPLRPGIDDPVRFSVAHLVDSASSIEEVQWDFDGDDIIDSVSDLTEASHTYLRTGVFTVTALVKYANQTQKRYTKDVEIYEPVPPPFPVSVVSEPDILISDPPFGTLWRIESDMPIKDVIWDFGDGEKARGDRVGHTFQKRGVYQVVAQVHAESGEIAEISKVVRVVNSLKLPDLEIDGTPTIGKNGTITGEVPVSVDYSPRTTMPLIDFYWEAPGATSVGTTDENLQAIYRRPGNYTITLIGQDPDGRVMRKRYALTVEPPSSRVSIRMTPDGGTAPLLVRFDASETVIPDEEITGFEWKFGDTKNSPQQRGAQVEYIFERPGTYEVQLVTYTTSGKTYDGQRTIVVRAPVLDACALPSRTKGVAPLGVSFDSSCTTGNPVSILWEFGDGSESDELNPVHVFEDPGIYKVKFTLEDDLGSISTEILNITAE